MTKSDISPSQHLKRFFTFILDCLAYLALAALLYVPYMMQPILGVDKAILKERSSPALLQHHVDMLSVKLPHRAAAPDLIEPTAQYIYAEFSRFSDDVSFQNFEVDGETFKNIIVRFGPRSRQSPVYIIGAHYDSEQGNPGADDNASGVAGLLELARLFSRRPPQVPVELAAYALEEPPHFRTKSMGSFQHAKSLFDNNREVALMISLEMLGYYSDDPNSQKYPLPGMNLLYPDSGNFIALVGRLSDPFIMRKYKKAFTHSTDLPVYSMNAPTLLPGVDFSDHLNFWRFDFPAIMITDTAFYRNPHYHKTSDTLDTLDFERMAKAVDGVFGSIIYSEAFSSF